MDNYPDLRILVPGDPTQRLTKRQINYCDLFSVEDALRARGFDVVGQGDLGDTHLAKTLASANNWSEEQRVSFIDAFEKLRKSSNRQQARKDVPDDRLKEYSTTIEALVGFLAIHHLGALSAAFGVHIAGSPEGSDFDCIANFGQTLVAFEVKGGKAKNITRDEVAMFIKRHEFLAPTISIMLLDRQRVDSTVLANLFSQIDSYRWKIQWILGVDVFQTDPAKTSNPVKIARIHLIHKNIFVVDCWKGDLLRNIQETLKFYWRFQAYHGHNVVQSGFDPEHLSLEYRGKSLFGDAPT